jgi:hypothetical protein
MQQVNAYPIGTPGQPWGESEKQEWLGRQQVRRSYADEVTGKLEKLASDLTVTSYGELAQAGKSYPLWVVSTGAWQASRPGVLVTGGVHGYETSGVQGAIRFLQTRARQFADQFNILVAPCVSPWAYETINRWNAQAIDPNRSFYDASPCMESAALMDYLSARRLRFMAHFDLHETTETDNSEFRPALAARDGVKHENWHIPDGFYCVGDTQKPVPAFQAAIIRSVEKVTHIAPPDADGRIIGEDLQQPGVINYEASKLGLCMGLTDAAFVTTTEMYPDSPRTNAEECIKAQVAAVEGGLAHIAAHGG